MRLWMKGLIGLVILTVIGFIGFRVFQDAIMWRIFDRAMEARFSSDPASDQADGLHVYMCGTGSPAPDHKRAATCIGVVAGDQAFIFDSGSGGIRKLTRMQFPMGQMQAAFITHLHSDHIDGLGEMMLMAWIGDSAFRSERLPIFGPRGTEHVVQAFNSAYEFDRSYRVAHHSAAGATPSGYGGTPQDVVLPAGPSAKKVIYQNEDVIITAIRVSHAPIEPAFGYRVDYKDRSISISGDTIYHPGFVAASKGVDVMFHEAEDPEMINRMAAALETSGRDVTAEVLTDTLDYHATPEDAAKAAAEAEAAELIYYHIMPPLPSPALYSIWIGDADKAFDGKITVGEDGMLISLPAESDKIIKTRAF